MRNIFVDTTGRYYLETSPGVIQWMIDDDINGQLAPPATDSLVYYLHDGPLSFYDFEHHVIHEADEI